MVEKQVEFTAPTREDLAYELAPVLARAVAAGGPHTTLLDAHRALADPANKLELSVPSIKPDGSVTAAGIIIIITS